VAVKSGPTPAVGWLNRTKLKELRVLLMTNPFLFCFFASCNVLFHFRSIAKALCEIE
jgi:hypothetical protein